MKKLFRTTIFTAAICAVFASCSDDTLTSGIEFPEGTPSEITLDHSGALQSVPVNANGDWTATVEYDGITDEDETLQWVGLLNEGGHGSSPLEFVVDANNSSKIRSARIILSSGDKKLVYKVSQQPVGFGDDNTDVDLSMFGGQVPLGFGIRMNRPSPSDGKVINILLNPVFTLDGFAGYDSGNKSLKDLTDEFGINPQSYIRMDTTGVVNADLIQKDAAESQGRLIGASLKVNIAYGLFKLNLNGSFRMFGASSDTTYTFSLLSAPNKGSIVMNENNILRDYEDLEPVESDSKQKAQNRKKARSLIMSNSFTTLRDKIEKLVAEGQTYKKGDKNELYRKLVLLNNNYGPAYIRSAEVGASAELVYNFKSQAATDTMKIHGDLTIGLTSLLSLDVKAEADYRNYMKSHINETSFSYRIRGGDPVKAVEVGDKLGMLMDKSKNDQISTTDVTKALSKWSSSIRVNNPSNVTCISYNPTPIWNLFSDEAQEEIIHFFWDMYPNGSKGECPYTYDVRWQIENLGYEFDTKK